MSGSIPEFIQKIQPKVLAAAPARINLISPLDAVEADYWAPALAITSKQNPLAAYCYIKEIKNSEYSVIRVFKGSFDDFEIEFEKEFKLRDCFLPEMDLKDKSDAIYLGTLNYLANHIPEIQAKLREKQIEFGILSTIPRQSGIGGSSSLIIALIWAVGCFCGLDNKNPQSFIKLPFNRDVIAELSTEIENLVLKNTAGYGDRYTIARGGIGFTSYVGKLHHPKIGEGPLGVYDRIDLTYKIHQIPIILAFSGIQHTSGDIHKVLREKYLQNDQYLNKQYNELARISWQSRFAIMKHDWKLLGNYFDRNTEITEAIMRYVGFKQGIGWANKILIDCIKDQPDVYGVKLSGAGGGGSVFAIVNPEVKQNIMRLWHMNLEKLLQDPSNLHNQIPEVSIEQIDEMRNAQFFDIMINTSGVSLVD